MWRRVRRAVLRAFAAAERPAAWVLLVGAAVTLIGIATNLLVLGTAKWATVLIAADLLVSGFAAVQDAEDDEPAA